MQDFLETKPGHHIEIDSFSGLKLLCLWGLYKVSILNLASALGTFGMGFTFWTHELHCLPSLHWLFHLVFVHDAYFNFLSTLFGRRLEEQKLYSIRRRKQTLTEK